jgi:hypothetical protein
VHDYNELVGLLRPSGRPAIFLDRFVEAPLPRVGIAEQAMQPLQDLAVIDVCDRGI